MGVNEPGTVLLCTALRGCYEAGKRGKHQAGTWSAPIPGSALSLFCLQHFKATRHKNLAERYPSKPLLPASLVKERAPASDMDF